MKIKLTSIMVDDQDRALKFYTEVLGFVKKHDIPMGEFKWLTVVSPEGPNDIELLLEPNKNPALRGAEKNFQKALFDAGIPATVFFVDNIQQEYDRLKKLGVVFNKELVKAEWGTTAVLDDTCGNLIQIHQLNN